MTYNRNKKEKKYFQIDQTKAERERTDKDKQLQENERINGLNKQGRKYSGIYLKQKDIDQSKK